jgi:glycine betaine/choline ABC-type transport system substrate-binding protein
MPLGNITDRPLIGMDISLPADVVKNQAVKVTDRFSTGSKMKSNALGTVPLHKVTLHFS